jgi:hypothetical protein
MFQFRSLRRWCLAALMGYQAQRTLTRPRPPRVRTSLEPLEDRCLLSFTEFAVPTPHSALTALTAGPDGNLWFLEFSANQIGKISTDGAVTEYAIPTPNSEPVGLAAGPDGNLWFAEFNGNKVGRITPDGAVTEFPGPTPNSHLQQITAGADGNLWFIDEQGGPSRSGAIGRYWGHSSILTRIEEYPGIRDSRNSCGTRGSVTAPTDRVPRRAQDLWLRRPGRLVRLWVRFTDPHWDVIAWLGEGGAARPGHVIAVGEEYPAD